MNSAKDGYPGVISDAEILKTIAIETDEGYHVGVCANICADKKTYKEKTVNNSWFSLRSFNLLIILALLAVYQTISSDRAADEAAALEQANAKAAEQVSEASVSVYNNGTFSGSAQGYGGLIEVEVVIENDIIRDINVLSHSGEDAAYWDMASSMIPEMIRVQSPNVDTVSGATYSSTGIHNAVTEALKSALAEQEK